MPIVRSIRLALGGTCQTSGPIEPIRLRMTATMSGPPAKPIRKVTDEPGSLKGRLPSSDAEGDPDEHRHDGRLGQPLPRFAGVLGEGVDGLGLSHHPELVPELQPETRPRRELHACADDAGHDQAICLAQVHLLDGLPDDPPAGHEDPPAGDVGARPGEVDGDLHADGGFQPFERLGRPDGMYPVPDPDLCLGPGDLLGPDAREKAGR